MNRIFLIAALTVAPLLAQSEPNLSIQLPQMPQMPQLGQLGQLQSLDQLQQLQKLPQLIPDLQDIDTMLSSVDSALAYADTSLSKLGISLQPKAPTGRFDGDYDRGMRALDDHKYDEAVRRFDAVINGKSSRVDGALYWKAYSLNRLGRRDDALAALAQLRRDYASSHWLNDAQALEAEVRQGSGQAISPAQESNEDLKLLAINSLMNADPDRAIPLLEDVLKGNSSPKVKDRALFVLTQNRSPQAQQVLMNYAKGSGNPDLQVRAIRYIGQSGTPEARQQLLSIYNSSTDTSVKHQIIQSLLVSNAKDTLLTIAKNEKDQDLRFSAIRQLGAMRAADQLGQLYTAESSTDVKAEIIRSLFVAQATDKLLDIVRNEKDPRLHSEALRNLSMTNGISSDALAGVYSSETDSKAKQQIINGLFAHGDAKLLIDLARKESDPQMKMYIVRQLSMMHNKDATDYMMEILK